MLIVRLQTLRYEIDGLKMKDSESVEDFYNRVILLLNQLRLNGEPVEDQRVVEKISEVYPEILNTWNIAVS